MEPEEQMLARFRQGRTIMGTATIELYREGDKIIKHTWGMGGPSKEAVSAVPVSIFGYVRAD